MVTAADDVAADATQPDTSTTAPAADASAPFDNAPLPNGEAAAPAPELSREERLDIENQRLRRELDSAVDRLKRSGELVDEVDRADSIYESAKAEAKRAKEQREQAKASLRALIKGEVQVEIDMSEKDDGQHAPGPVETPVSQQVTHRTVAGTFGAWQFGLTVKALEACENMPLLKIEPELAARKVRGIEILGGKAYLPLEAHYYGDGSGYVNAWPLLDPSDWDGLHAEKYGSAVRDLTDESPDVVARRKTGGEWNGVTVKQGRRKFVVGPDDQVVRLVFTQIQGFPGDAAFEAKQHIAPENYGPETLSFPAAQLPDRLAARLAEYVPTASGFHEGLASALAGDLKVDAGEVVAAAQAYAARFEVVLERAGSESEEVIRLLATPAANG
jgi:hypothetical protein